MKKYALLACLILILSGLVGPAFASTTTQDSGLPIPRFVTLRATEVNLRTGPGVRYPIDWVYHVKGLPVEVIGEFDTWRKIRDIDGAEGWVHLSVLSGKRNTIINASQTNLYRDPAYTSPLVATIERNVVARLVECEGNWCRIEAGGLRGWSERNHLWGVYANEMVQ